MSKLILSVLIVFSMFNYSLASDCPEKVQVIEKGQEANCDGFLFSDEAEKEAAEARDDVKYYKKLTTKLEKRIEIGNKSEDIVLKRLETYKTISDELAKEKARNENLELIKNTVYFSFGALVTAIIANNVR